MNVYLHLLFINDIFTIIYITVYKILTNVHHNELAIILIQMTNYKNYNIITQSTKKLNLNRLGPKEHDRKVENVLGRVRVVAYEHIYSNRA